MYICVDRFTATYGDPRSGWNQNAFILNRELLISFFYYQSDVRSCLLILRSIKTANLFCVKTQHHFVCPDIYNFYGCLYSFPFVVPNFFWHLWCLARRSHTGVKEILNLVLFNPPDCCRFLLHLQFKSD